MKNTITFDELKEKFVTKFKTEKSFKSWWIKERKKLISSGYPDKPIMKLAVDRHQIVPKLIKSLKLKSTHIVESNDYPTPPIDIKFYFRNYKLFY